MAQPMWHMQMGGLPQSEEIRPQYFPTYPIYFFTSFHRYLGWRYILTMFCAGLGMYMFLRQISIMRWAALWGGIAYMSAPTLMAFTFAGQYAKMGVIALYPWMWYFLDRGLSERRIITLCGFGRRDSMGDLLAAPQDALLRSVWDGSLLSFLHVSMVSDGARLEPVLAPHGLLCLCRDVGVGSGGGRNVPLYSYTGSESKRAAGQDGSGRTDAEQLAYAQSWSLHPEEVASLIVPEFGGFRLPKENSSTYWGRNPGKDNSAFWCARCCAGRDCHRRYAARSTSSIPECSICALSGLYAGGIRPFTGLPIIYCRELSCFARWVWPLTLFAFPACVLAAMGLARLLEADEDGRETSQKHLLISAGVIAVLALLIAMMPGGMTSLWNGVF